MWITITESSNQTNLIELETNSCCARSESGQAWGNVSELSNIGKRLAYDKRRKMMEMQGAQHTTLVLKNYYFLVAQR